MSLGCLTTKNAPARSGSNQARTHLQSKYGITAQNKMIASGQLTGKSNPQTLSISGSDTKGFSSNMSLRVKESEPSRARDESKSSKYTNPYLQLFHHNHTATQSKAEAEQERSTMRDFKSSSLLDSLRINRRASEAGNKSVSTSKYRVASQEQISRLKAPTTVSTQAIVRDIRDATTVKEVRDIMSQVKAKYRGSRSNLESLRA